MDKDHIHILCGTHPRDISRSDCPDIQGYYSEKNILGGNHRLSKDLWGEEFWTDGYYVATVGEKGGIRQLWKSI